MNWHAATRPSPARTVVLVVAALVGLATGSTAHAALDVSFGADVKLDDDTGIYVAVSSRCFDRDRTDVRRWHHQCEDPDDLAVVLFLAQQARTSPDYVFSLRATGLSWWQIGLRIGVPADAWFPAVRRDPGPPYGKAYGHWKKQGRRNPTEMHLSDTDARHLVAVQVLHRYWGISVEEAMDWRASERPLAEINGRAYRGRHGHDPDRGVAYGTMVGGPDKAREPDKAIDPHPGKGRKSGR